MWTEANQEIIVFNAPLLIALDEKLSAISYLEDYVI